MVDRIEGLCNVCQNEAGPKRRFAVVEPLSNFIDSWEKGGDGGVEGGEAMLGRGAMKRGREERKEEALKDFRGRTKKGNGAVR